MKVLARLLILLLFIGGLVVCDDRNSNNGSPSTLEDVGRDAAQLDDATQTDDATPDTDTTQDTDTTRTDDATPTSGGPEIVDFTVSHTRLTTTGTVDISVAIIHPQGFAEIGGGKIFDESDAVYATFTGSGGTFSASLTWDGIQNLSRIDFAQNQTRTFIAEFFDSTNRRTRKSFTIELHCDGTPACNGACKFTRCTDDCNGALCNAAGCVAQEELSDDSLNCGACGNACGTSAVCRNSTCECGFGQERCNETCTDLQNDSKNCGACGQSCEAGTVCNSGECAKQSYSGAFCEENEDCGNGSCLAFIGAPICQVDCNFQGECFDDELECVELDGLLAPACFKPCIHNNDCAPGESCLNAQEATGTGPDRSFCAFEYF